MSATGRSYTQNFFKVQYIIIQAILSRKWMKKFAVTDEKYSIRLLTVKNNSHADMRTSHTQLLEKAVSMERTTPKREFFDKKSTSPVKKSR